MIFVSYMSFMGFFQVYRISITETSDYLVAISAIIQIVLNISSINCCIFPNICS